MNDVNKLTELEEKFIERHRAVFAKVARIKRQMGTKKAANNTDDPGDIKAKKEALAYSVLAKEYANILEKFFGLPHDQVVALANDGVWTEISKDLRKDISREIDGILSGNKEDWE